jgi:ferredoxin-NADP reductase
MDLDAGSFSYIAGQAALLGMAGQPERVPYSIASAPEETRAQGHLEFLLKQEPGGGWGPHLSGLRRGSTMAVEGPVGSFVFPPRVDERHVLFVAGGTGIAPLRSMILHALATRQRRGLHLLYSARTPHDFAYATELRRYAREGLLELSLTATREVPPHWRGGHGRITRERLAKLLATRETLCFVCGPATLVEAVPRMLLELGVEKDRIRVEEW